MEENKNENTEEKNTNNSNNSEKSNEEENEILVKQKLIKEKILDQHFGKDEFFSYCMNIKPDNGDNLKNWTIEELNQTIDNFISEKNKY